MLSCGVFINCLIVCKITATFDLTYKCKYCKPIRVPMYTLPPYMGALCWGSVASISQVTCTPTFSFSYRYYMYTLC